MDYNSRLNKESTNKMMHITYLLKSNRLCVKNVRVNSSPENMNKYRKYITDIRCIL